MKKKGLRFLVLILSLGSAAVCLRYASWKKQEDRFHLSAHDWLKNDVENVSVYTPGKEISNVLLDESADSLLAIDQMKLVAARSPRPRGKEMIFISMSTGGSVGEPFGFYLDPYEERGWIEIPVPEPDSWKNYELAPETCRALKERVFELQN